VSDDLLQSVEQKICEGLCFTISEFLCEFPQISCTVLYEIITVWLGYHKFCARCVMKMLMGVHKIQRMALALTLLERYQKDGTEFLNHIIPITGDETWVSFVNVETKEQSKQWMHTHSPNKAKKFKQTLSACQKADDSCFLRQEMSADAGIHATKDHSNVKCFAKH
jgi:hypothetical protein